MAVGESQFGAEVKEKMRGILLIGILLTALFVVGCSSGPAAGTNSGTNNSSNTTKSENVNSTAPQPQTAATVPVGPEQAVPATNPMAGQRKPLVETDPNSPIPEPQRNPGPENSEIAVTMDKQGNFVELRFFKADPHIVKAERIMSSPGKSVVKIWLNNGKVISAPGDSFESLATVPKATLYGLVGVKSKPSAADTGAK